MKKICINSRDELVIIDLDAVACIKAAGNYSTFVYADGRELTLTVGLARIENIIATYFDARAASSGFVRLGRSCIINSSMLSKIDMLRCQLTLSAGSGKEQRLAVPKKILRQYKDLVDAQFERLKQSSQS